MKTMMKLNKRGFVVEIQIVWSIKDILRRENNYNLTKEEASEILQELIKYHDAESGINWDMIDDIIEDKVYDRK